MTDTPISSASSILAEEPTELWRHENPESTQMWKFKEVIEKKYNLRFEDYHELHRWTVENVGEFWEELWRFTGIVAEEGYSEVGVRSFVVLLQGCEEEKGE
jgi:hypothetical protein